MAHLPDILLPLSAFHAAVHPWKYASPHLYCGNQTYRRTKMCIRDSLSLFAKTISNAKLVAKVNRLAYDDIIDSLDIGSVIYPKYITAAYILQYVRATQNSIGSNVETLYHILDGKAEALEFKICDNSPIVGRTLSELNLKKNLLVGCLYRDRCV